MSKDFDIDEVRQALRRGRIKGSSTQCSVCGKPDSRDHTAIGKIHKQVKELGIPHKLKLIENALLGSTIDLSRRKEWTLQAETYRSQIKKARAEHDTYVPLGAPLSNKMRNETIDVIRSCAELLGHRIPESENGVPLSELVSAYRLKEILLNLLVR